MKSLLFIFALLVLFSGAMDCRAGKAFNILSPPDYSFVESAEMSIALEFDKRAVESVQVVIGDKKPTNISVRTGGTGACFGLTLDKGLNTITVLGLKNGEIVERKKVRIFFRSDLFPAFRVPPASFQRYFFHTVENEKGCTDCHDMEPTLSSLRPAAPEESPCYTCHVRKNTDSFVHNPAVKWTCFTCHEVLQGQRKYTAPKPDEKVCYPCHNYEVRKWKSKKVLHGPTATGHCTLCHDPHGTGRPALLRMQTTDLCINCHEDKATGAHVIAGFYGKGHPVRGVKDPFNADREFTCAGCHNPHSGDTQDLLNHDNSNMTVYCSLCHKM